MQKEIDCRASLAMTGKSARNDERSDRDDEKGVCDDGKQKGMKKPLRPCGTPPLTSGGLNGGKAVALKPLLQGEVARSAGGVFINEMTNLAHVTKPSPCHPARNEMTRMVKQCFLRYLQNERYYQILIEKA